MLVLSRKPGEKLVIGGVTVTVLGARGDRVRLGIEAPDEVRVLRGELAWGRGEPAGGGEAAPARITAAAT